MLKNTLSRWKKAHGEICGKYILCVQQHYPHNKFNELGTAVSVLMEEEFTVNNYQCTAFLREEDFTVNN